MKERLKLEFFSLLVIALSLSVVVFSDYRGGSAAAASLRSGILRLAGSEQVTIICNGSKLTVTTQSATQALTSCLAAVVTPPPTTTTLPTTPPTGGTGSTVPASGDSMAMMIWSKTGKNVPNPAYDKCDDGTDIVAAHNMFFVIAPDGKRYPTWHPAVVTNPITNKGKCYFGHEHGRDPKGSAIWLQAQQYFYFDANKNGAMDAPEQAVAGIPFGYANEQLDVYAAAKGMPIMRHEDHVGHKIEWANGEMDMGTDQFDNSYTGGVVVPIKTSSGNPKWNMSGVRCYHLAHTHQGVNSPDAFTMNLHEVAYFSDCRSSNSAYVMKNSMTELMQFGKAGEFTNLCDGAGDRTTPVVLGTDSTNSKYPGSRDDGQRMIIQRSCIEKYFLVPEGQYSSNFYEAWPGSLKITTAGGKLISNTPQILFDVEDASRYYWPGHTDPATGQANTGRSMDLCYENLNGRQYRGITCDTATNYGQITGIKWDSPKSAFRGLHRGMYFQPPAVENAGGPEYWYTDPFGNNASTTPFAGSIRQQIVSKNVNYDTMIGPTDPRVNDREHDDGNGTVHAPN